MKKVLTQNELGSNLSSQARLLFQHNRTAKDCNTFEKT
jgi:hypothetical protein